MKTDVLTSAFIDLRGKLHRMATRLLRDDEDARDALQDTFEKLWSRDDIQSDPEARHKLVRALHNTCIDRLRARRTVPLDTLGTEIGGTCETPVEDIERYERLILNGLTPTQRRIYELSARDCLDYDEIARALSMTVEAVRMNMSRARRRISENIKIIDR